MKCDWCFPGCNHRLQAELEALEDREHLQQQRRSPAAEQGGISSRRRVNGSYEQKSSIQLADV